MADGPIGLRKSLVIRLNMSIKDIADMIPGIVPIVNCVLKEFLHAPQHQVHQR